MRTTIELDDQLHQRLRRRAQREGVSLSHLLGRVVAQASEVPAAQAPPQRRSGRFTVLASPVAGTRTTTETVQRAVDDEGAL